MQEQIERVYDFVSQEQDYYAVKTQNEGIVKIAKPALKKLEPYPFKKNGFHDNWAKIAAIGIFIGGVLAVVFSPLIIRENIRLLSTHSLSPSERVHAKNLIVISIFFFWLGLFFLALLIMHLIY